MVLFVDISDTIEESDFSFNHITPIKQSKSPEKRQTDFKTPQLSPKKLYESPLKRLFDDQDKKRARIESTSEREPMTESTPVKKARTQISSPKLDLSKYSSKELAEANRVKRTRPEIMAEMIIYLPEKFHQHISDDTFEEVEVRQTHGSEIYWKRKVNADYNKSRDIFLPCPMHEIEEPTSVLFYEAERFIDKLTKGRVEVPEHTIIMVEHFNQQLAKLDVLENRIYKDKVLGTGKFDQDVEITAKQVENLVNKLEFQRNVNLFPVRTIEDAIMWLVSFTYTLAFSRYDRSERNIEYSNLLSIKANDSKGVLIEIMKKFKLMTLAKCERLYNYYNSLYKLYQQVVIGEIGKDDNDKRLVPETAENAIRIVLTSEDPNQVIYE